eukprot:gb/GEZN01007456.1/.p1 GENE.gb/GEZN01007456.1/~~gb/GEZN01007456.1/.p1  ORF type:complete len:403 (-),score=33.08 gb/GEZN01007456.1/:198-1406(-)
MGDLAVLLFQASTHSEQEGYNALILTLTSLYAVLVCVAVFQLSRILWYGHALFSFQCGFAMLCLVWGAIRVVFLLHTGAWTTVLTLFLFWLPLDLQFTTFSLFGVFLANLLYEYQWDQHKQRFFVVCILSNIGIVTMTTVVLAMGHSAHKFLFDVEKLHHLYISCLFFLLTLAYGTALFTAAQRRDVLHAPNDPITHFQIVLTILIAFLLLASRTVYNFCAWRHAHELQVTNYNWSIDPFAGLLLMLWELFPAFSVLLYFRHIPKTSYHRPCQCLRSCWHHISTTVCRTPTSAYSGSPFNPISYQHLLPSPLTPYRETSAGSDDLIQLLPSVPHASVRSRSFGEYDETNYDTSPSQSDGESQWHSAEMGGDSSSELNSGISHDLEYNEYQSAAHRLPDHRRQ